MSAAPRIARDPVQTARAVLGWTMTVIGAALMAGGAAVALGAF